MEVLTLIVTVSGIIWYIIDRAKQFYSEVKYSKWITVGISAVLSAACVFCFNLDILSALQLIEAPSIMGEVLTTLIFMSGSSAVSEILGKVKSLGSK